MGNYLSCSEAMSDYLIKENSIYQLRYTFAIISTLIIWILFIRNKELTTHYKYIVIPIILFIIILHIISSILSTIIGLFLYWNGHLNKLIDKCLLWQDKHKGICPSSYQGVCYIDPEIIVDWNENDIFI